MYKFVSCLRCDSLKQEEGKVDEFLCTERHFVHNNNDLKAIVHHNVSPFFLSLLLQFQVLNGSESPLKTPSLHGYHVAFDVAFISCTID